MSTLQPGVGRCAHHFTDPPCRAGDAAAGHATRRAGWPAGWLQRAMPAPPRKAKVQPRPAAISLPVMFPHPTSASARVALPRPRRAARCWLLVLVLASTGAPAAVTE